jgi:putative membrane protein
MSGVDELASRRTGMAFQRTRMSADRTLMAVIRTALSLIGFGFTIYQIFKKLYEANLLRSGGSARNFGAALVLLGVAMVVIGIVYHLQFMASLRRMRAAMVQSGLIHGESGFPVSMTLIVAIILLVIGMTAIVAIVGGEGPLS